MTICLWLIFLPASSTAQSQNTRERIAVLNIDTKGITSTDPAQMGNIVRTELEKLNKYEVVDNYDIEYLLRNAGLSIEKCYGKQCLVDIGKKIRADKMMSGFVELYGEQIVVNLKLIDVGSESVEKTQVLEFLNLRGQLPTMISLTMKKLYDQPIDNETFTKLTKKFDYESAVNNPEIDRLNLSGPRMGLTVFTGQAARTLQAKESEGGFDAFPYMFQFGYQFEVQYLNQGSFQALFEFIPIITGLDQGRFLPSISILHGLRSNIRGWELAFGPVLKMSKVADGYINESGVWILGNPPKDKNFERESRFHSQGEPNFDSGFVFAFGKSFKSGKMNIPVNIFFLPSKGGHQFGLSMGFNAKRH
jgi:hypothetical protein